ncbi:hypothetical protein CspeluHIS016_0203840 [Cutaneotrichosporon spelunceum]|uniref:Kinesin motor domain-containing protein n=1 Tax=Cutaneotrichosporon spelunceum TaxID=1672016 RepID=A0AAD3YAS0_9TREE|nr:hypothetical protein CspeluHIS016_0203840 [Cutaneotrichosporon spelunceum]
MSGTAHTPRHRASLVTSPTPNTPSSIPRPQSASGRYKMGMGLPGLADTVASNSTTPDDAEKGQVQVVLRIRPSEPADPTIAPRHRQVLVHPISPNDVRVSVDPAVLAGTNTIVSSAKRHPTFTFDHVMGEQASQLDMYEVVSKDRIEEFLRGFNVTYLAYGQTSSGKSYSMGTTGEDADYMDIEEASRAGLIPRTVETVFRRADEIRLASGPGASWECRVSFLELYNEDMIDLLANTGMPVSIRENADGRIVWSGVREIKVSNVSEVMTLLREGSTRRRTGETNMNATSSRSHAIFSLTLIQSRRMDSCPNGDDGPRTPNGRRPQSVMLGGGSRSSTPVFSRAPPSSFGKIGAGRPNSVHVGAMGRGTDDEMVVLTSKFNMVDLAGSERLKRTAAQGERMKEGISINSGLLALGNVISALSEPAKNRGHIPYRDSKLTRLLQDSIGGNAMTTMIACVSPLEYNISETLNTINYASRARRIKNAVQKNQAEVGWDDIDHLRNTVTKLRAKLATIEADGPRETPSRGANGANNEEALLRQVAELQDKLTDLEDEFSHLQDQYFHKCREIVALSDPDQFEDEDDKLRQFNETIEPVVLEYEKVVASLTSQLAEERASSALAQQAHEEQAMDLTKTQERLSEHEAYVTELKSRITKLTERNDSSEAYIRDLETKFRGFTDNDDRQTEVITGLTSEIQQLKTDSVKSNTYISQLEARVATAEARSVELAQLVERYEQEAEHREKAIADLEERLSMIDSQPNVDMLLEEIETRDRRIESLEARLQEHSEPISTNSRRDLSTIAETGPSTPPETPPVLRTIAEDAESEVDLLRKDNEVLIARLQEAEARLEQIQPGPATPTLEPPSERDEELEDEDGARVPDSPNKRGSTSNDSSESDTALQTPKLTSRAVSPQIHDDPLHQAMMRSPYAQSRSSDFRNSARSEQLRLLRPLSLSQGLSGYAYATSSPRYSWSSSPSNGTAYERSPKAERFPKRQSMPFDSMKPIRSVQSLEIDLSLLQKTVVDREAQLRQREAEIQYLKRSLEKSSAFTNGSPLNSDEVIERLREDHSNEIQKMFKEHKLAMEDLELTQKQTFKSVSEDLSKARQEHARELEELNISHKAKMDEFEARQKAESSETAELRTALDAAWEEVAATGRRQEAERNNLTSQHHQKVAELEERHAAVLGALQGELAASANSLKSIREELAAATEAKERAEKDLANRPDVKDLIPLEEHNIVVQAMEEMEKALTAAEDEKRQLKISADQVKFELSRIRDEHEMQRSGDLNRVAELEKRCSTLSADNAQLQQQVERNRDSKTSIIDSRSSRTKLPPIGPPPTAPLPPLPAGREAIMSPTLTNSSLPRMSHHEGSTESARSSRYDHDSHDGHHPRSVSHASMVRPDSVATNAEVERDRAFAEREEALRHISETEERLLDLKSQLETEQRNNEAFTKDLIELRKTNSKLKVRVDDVNRELAELKRERDSLRRDVVEMKNELADAKYERIADRQRLEGARNEVQQYKAQLERAVDRKVSKRSDQKLKSFHLGFATCQYRPVSAPCHVRWLADTAGPALRREAAVAL